MSDLAATNCGGCTQTTNNGGCNCMWIILILLFCGGWNNNDSCGCGNGVGLFNNGNSCGCDALIWILLLSCCGCGF